MRTPHLMTLFCLFFASMMLVSSCKNDDDNPTTGGEFTINGDTRALSKGFIESYGDNGNGSFDFDVTLVSDGITVDVAGDLAGNGSLIYLDLNSGASTGLEEGRYTFSSERNALTFVDGSVSLDLDVVSGTGELFNITGGTIDIELSSGNTIMTFSLNIDNGSTVSGSFRGVLQPF